MGDDEQAQGTARDQPDEDPPEERDGVRGRPFEPGNQWRFPPGVSGNPAGRPKGVSSVVRELLEEIPKDDPDKRTRLLTLFQSMYVDARGGIEERVVGEGTEARIVRIRRRGSVQHARELLDRGFGRVPIAIKPVVDDDPESLAGIQIVTVGDEGEVLEMESAKPRLTGGNGGTPKPDIPE